jgi:uncharacterized membrane protein YbaN (DUF454 family)
VNAPPGDVPTSGATKRYVFLGLAGVMFVLAVLGVLLPVLPTTPFLLLTSYFLVRSSPRLNQKLLESKLFGPFLRDWARHHGVRLHVKVTAIVVTLGGVALSLIFGNLPPIGVAALLILAAIGLVVVVRLRTVKEQN